MVMAISCTWIQVLLVEGLLKKQKTFSSLLVFVFGFSVLDASKCLGHLLLMVQLFIRKMNMFANDDVVIPDGLGFDLTYWRDLFPYAVVNDIGWTTQGWALVCHYVENRVGPHNPFCLSTPYFSFSTDHREESTKPLKFERIKCRRIESMLPIPVNLQLICLSFCIFWVT